MPTITCFCNSTIFRFVRNTN